MSGAAGVFIRPAVADDAAAIAALHLAVRRRIYRDIAPPALFTDDYEASRRRWWREALSHPRPGATTLVAEGDGIAGFAHGGPGEDAPFLGRYELKHLFVDDGRRRRGCGAALLAAMRDRAAAAGFAAMALGVVEENADAIGFYERIGGRREGDYVDRGPLWPSRNRLYVFDA